MVINKETLKSLALGGLSLYGVGATMLYTQTRKNNESLLKESQKTQSKSKDLENEIFHLSKELGKEVAEKDALFCNLKDAEFALKETQRANARLNTAITKQRLFQKKKREERREKQKLLDEETAYEINGFMNKLSSDAAVISDLNDEIVRLSTELAKAQAQLQNQKQGGGKRGRK